jgi:purine-nucleoside phosphorylase
MSDSFSQTDYQAVADILRSHAPVPPRIGLILGSGLGVLAEEIEGAVRVPYASLPKFPVSTVYGHAGQWVLGRLADQPIAVMQGRVHFYEGFSMAQVAFPVRVMQALGLEILIVTNAAGSLNPSYAAGDLMLIKDHLNFMGMAGQNPLMGPNDDSLGPRFLPLNKPYDSELRALARQVAREHHIALHEGVYVALSGPFFETPAEIRALRILGGDAVGMSTAPEVLVARHAGLRVLGLSSITNVGIDDEESDLFVDHEFVLEVGQSIVPRLMTLIRGVLAAL